MKLSDAKKRAEEFVKARKYDKAIETYEKIVTGLEKHGKAVDVRIYNTLGDLYRRTGNKEKAIMNIRKAMEMYRKDGIIQQATAMGKMILRIDSSNKEVLRELAVLYKEKGVMTESISYYRQWIEHLLSNNERSKAAQMYEEMLEIPAVPLQEYKNLIDLYMSMGEMDKAKQKLMDLYMKASEVNDENMLKYVKKLQTKLGVEIIKEEEIKEEPKEEKQEEPDVSVTDDLEDVISSIDEEIQIEEDEIEEDVASIATDKDVSVDTNSDEKYIKEYLDIVKMSLEIDEIDQAVEYLMLAASTYLKINNIKEAMKLLKRAAEIDPENVQVRQQIIQLCVKLNDRECVIKEYIGLADAYLKKGNEKQAELVLNRALKISPDNEELTQRLESLKTGNTGDTFIEDLIKETAEETKTPITANDIIKGNDEGGMKFTVDDESDLTDDENFFSMDEIIEELKKGLQDNISEDDVDTHYDMGLTFKEMGMIDDAINEFKISLKSPKTELKSVGMLAQCYSDKGEREKAYKMVIKGLKIPRYSDNDKVGLFYQLGTMYEEDNRYKEALMIYKKILKIDKNFHDVLQRAKIVLEALKRGGVSQSAPTPKPQPKPAPKPTDDDDDDIDIGPISYV